MTLSTLSIGWVPWARARPGSLGLHVNIWPTKIKNLRNQQNHCCYKPKSICSIKKYVFTMVLYTFWLEKLIWAYKTMVLLISLFLFFYFFFGQTFSPQPGTLLRPWSHLGSSGAIRRCLGPCGPSTAVWRHPEASGVTRYTDIYIYIYIYIYVIPQILALRTNGLRA